MTTPLYRRRAGETVTSTTWETFQARVDQWLMSCFGAKIARDRTERNHRFLEEALELVQSGGCTASEAHQLVDYVYGRPVGDMTQEVGGVLNTLAGFCLAYDIDMEEAGETELARVWTKVETIRAKQAAAPKHSPLPEEPAPAPDAREALEAARSVLERCRDREHNPFEPGNQTPLYEAVNAALASIDASLSREVG